MSTSHLGCVLSIPTALEASSTCGSKLRLTVKLLGGKLRLPRARAARRR